jgi:uncharacterized membrane protein
MSRRSSPRHQARAAAAVFTLAALCAAGCGKLASPAADEAPAPVAASVAPPPSPAAITHHGLGLRGRAVLGKDGYGITPCGESGQRIMEIDPAAQPFLDAYLKGGAHEFFVEAEGQVLDDGHARVTRFHRLYSQGPGCEAQLDPDAFVAWGNEPFWAASDAGGGLRLEQPGADSLTATDSEARSEKGEWIVEGHTAKGLLSLRLVPGLCRDGMSDALYGWSATASFGDKQLKGCGFPGFERAQKK